MSAATFEIGLYKPEAEVDGQNVMFLRTWDAAALMRSISWLRYQNRDGRNIYIRPNGEHPLSLVDDLNKASVERMKREGFEPSVVVETSPANFQAWVNHGQILSKQESTAAAQALAERFGGDKSSADWRHFGRLAGFSNRKEKHRQPNDLFPFVKLIESHPGRQYSEAHVFIESVRAKLEEEARAARAQVRIDRQYSHTRLLTIQDFRSKAEYGGDGHRIDLAYAIYALSHGVPESEVRTAIASRDLSKKGSEARQVAYVERTVRKAWSSLRVDRNEALINVGYGY